jgi:hypothetical protein
LIYKHPDWMTREGLSGQPFFVVQEKALPRFLGGAVREKIFQHGEFPWETMIRDLPGRHFGAQGTLPRRATSCRLIDEATSSLTAEPVYQDELRDRLQEQADGSSAVRVDTIGLPQSIGQPKILQPHTGHVVVRIAWCASLPIRFQREVMTAQQENQAGKGAWSYTPIFAEPVAVARYLLAFWEVPRW